MVEVIEGLRAVEQSPADGLVLEGYILDCGENLVLVDTGFTPQDVDIYQNELRSMGRKWSDIDIILITHAHGDHIANLPLIKQKTRAKVMAGSGDADRIKERTGVDVDRRLLHGDVVEACGGIEAINVPGHSEGNLCFYLRSKRAMIAGDAIFGDAEGNLYAPFEKYCQDAEMAAREIARLLDYDFNTLLLSHGKNLMNDAKNMVVNLVRGV
jgi:glyoxylase-like metal-dependent hydrolase (beta-lactamase superfamily II)